MVTASGGDPVRETGAMISGMAPVLRPGMFVFCTIEDPDLAASATPDALGSFIEEEGVSLILPRERAVALNLPADAPMRCITLGVHSALDGVGLTAAVANALAEADIPCNMVAAYHHDHAFVPAEMADRAVEILKARAARG